MVTLFVGLVLFNLSMVWKYQLYHWEERELTVTDNTWLRVTDGGSIIDDKVIGRSQIVSDKTLYLGFQK